MRLVMYNQRGQARLGALLNARIVQRAQLVDLLRAARQLRYAQPLPNSMDQLLARGDLYLDSVRKFMAKIENLPESELRALAEADALLDPAKADLLPPVSKPGKIICVGLNYPIPGGDASPAPAYPVIFLKPTSTLVGSGGRVILPHASRETAGEVELAIVIGRYARHISVEQALDYVVGYTLAMDIGARDWEARTTQWTSGKLGDTFTPLGPIMLTADEMPDAARVVLSLTINGSIALRGRTSQMIFGIPALIAYLSEITTLLPGDIILTGSPKGVDDQSRGPVLLNPGERLIATASGLGQLVVDMVQEE
jgi:2-keto-4-pentenoate hydratase/2-oxohepta-3-ene-1,7-dioic acid hydratase in catechol pathway